MDIYMGQIDSSAFSLRSVDGYRLEEAFAMVFRKCYSYSFVDFVWIWILMV